MVEAGREGSEREGPARPAAAFDVDGTLVDSGYFHAVAWWEALRQCGHTVLMAPIQRSIGVGSGRLLDSVLGEDRDQDETEALDAAHAALVARFWPSLIALLGACDLLRGWQVVVASFASVRELDVLLEVIEADDAIAAVTGADDMAQAKPAPDVVGAALRKVGADPGRSVIVGDTVWDVRAAAQACAASACSAAGSAAANCSRPEPSWLIRTEAFQNAAALPACLDASILGAPRR